jgi:hypothetical protein
LGEIVRFLGRADKAAFARIYAVVKTEEAAMDARLSELLGQCAGRTKESDTETEQKPAQPSSEAPASEKLNPDGSDVP